MDAELKDSTQRVLDVAEKLFIAHGYNAITLRDIADELGIKQASLYYHFPAGKEQLFIAMAERLFHRHREGLNEALELAGADLRDQLHAAAAWLGSQRPVRFMAMMHADLAALSPQNKEHLDRVAYDAMFVPLRERFRKAQELGTIRSMHPDMLAGWFLWLMESLSYGESRLGAPPRTVMAHDLISMMLDGLRPRAEEVMVVAANVGLVGPQQLVSNA